VYDIIIKVKNYYIGTRYTQRSVTHDSLRYINILTYLLTYTQYSKTHQVSKRRFI